MIQCSQCEHYIQGPGGQIGFTCNPFTTIKEPECLVKWQLIKLDTMVRAYQATLDMYRRIAPMQEKMIRHMEREIDDIDEADAWKYDPDDENSEPPPDDQT